MRYPFILDIGGDPDDTFALLLALKSPQIPTTISTLAEYGQSTRLLESRLR